MLKTITTGSCFGSISSFSELSTLISILAALVCAPTSGQQGSSSPTLHQHASFGVFLDQDKNLKVGLICISIMAKDLVCVFSGLLDYFLPGFSLPCLSYSVILASLLILSIPFNSKICSV